MSLVIVRLFIWGQGHILSTYAITVHVFRDFSMMNELGG
jgi:hypothetical protein